MDMGNLQHRVWRAAIDQLIECWREDERKVVDLRTSPELIVLCTEPIELCTDAIELRTTAHATDLTVEADEMDDLAASA